MIVVKNKPLLDREEVLTGNPIVDLQHYSKKSGLGDFKTAIGMQRRKLLLDAVLENITLQQELSSVESQLQLVAGSMRVNGEVANIISETTAGMIPILRNRKNKLSERRTRSQVRDGVGKWRNTG